MIGIIPGSSKTFVVDGVFCENPVEGNIYVEPSSRRLFMFSREFKRSCPENGFFPIWTGEGKIITQFSNSKFESDVISLNLDSLSSSLTPEVAEQVVAEQKKHNSSNALEPVITNDDNLFTNCIKGIILERKLSLADLVEMASPAINEKTIAIFYSSLIKTAFMRLDKWYTWVTSILHLSYKITVFDSDESIIVKYSFPEDTFEVKEESLLQKVSDSDDSLKKIVKIIIALKGISKESFKDETTDEYTINNMFTIINSSKRMSGQIFSRFINFSGLSYEIQMFSDGDLVYSFKE